MLVPFDKSYCFSTLSVPQQVGLRQPTLKEWNELATLSIPCYDARFCNRMYRGIEASANRKQIITASSVFELSSRAYYPTVGRNKKKW